MRAIRSAIASDFARVVFIIFGFAPGRVTQQHAITRTRRACGRSECVHASLHTAVSALEPCNYRPLMRSTYTAVTLAHLSQ